MHKRKLYDTCLTARSFNHVNKSDTIIIYRAELVRFFQALLIIIITLLSGLASVPCSAATGPNDIHVGSELEFPPYAFVDDKGQTAGFSVDLIRAVTGAMGLSMKITTGTWDSVWNDLVDGRIDVLPIVAKLPERTTLVDFSLPHAETFDAFFVREGSRTIRNIEDARGKEIAVMRSDAAHLELMERNFQGNLVFVNTIPEGLSLIASGKHDAFLCSKLIGTLVIRKHGIKGLVAGPVIPDYKRVFSFAVKKGDTELLEKLNQGLLIVTANGEYQRIYDKWLTIDDPWQKYRKYLMPFIWAVTTFALIGAFWLVMLKRLVSKRTRELTERNKMLQQVRDGLGKTVTERTAELSTLNAALLSEIAERKRTEENLYALLSRQKAMLEAIPDIIMEVDRNKVYIWANQAGIEFFGEDVIGTEAAYYFEGEQATYNVVHPLFEGSEDVIYIESWQRRKDGQKRLLAWWCKVIKDESGNVAGALSSARDVTERRKAEEEKEKLQAQLLQAQKMEAIGHLAGGVAHDFNNALTAIIGFAYILRNRLKEDGQLVQNAEQIISVSNRAALTVSSLLAFSRKQVMQMKSVNINNIVSGMIEILDRIIGEDIYLRVNTAVHDLIVNVDTNQIEQVIMNLTTNARDAMPDGGTLTVTTEEIEIDENYIQMHQEGEAGKYAVLSVTDTGMGMDEKTRENIFDPFFTTKEVGKGTGLGLAMIFGTIKQHNGFINVYSEPEKGTTFKIYLPLAELTVNVMEEKGAGPVLSGTEAVLLAEDDEKVRYVTRTLLEEYGYSVIEAIDGKQAVELFRENRDRVHLVITDVIMPGQSGKDLHNELMKIAPDMKIIFLSGYPADILAKRGIIESDVNFISKPVNPEILLQKIREVLEK